MNGEKETVKDDRVNKDDRRQKGGAGRTLKYISTAAVSVFAVLYLLYHIIGGFASESELFIVTEVSAERTYDLDGAIFKNERVLLSGAYGIIDRQYSDGEKFDSNACVARIYTAASDPKTDAELAMIDEKIEIYEKSSLKNNGTVSLSLVEAQISDWYSKAQTGDGGKWAAEHESELFVLLARRELIASERVKFDSELEALYARRAQLITSLGSNYASVIPGVSGWYFSDYDGYETLYSSDKIVSRGTYVMTVSAFDALSDASPLAISGCVGSCMTDAAWYFVAKIPLSDASLFVDGKYYTVGYEFGTTDVKCRLAKTVSDPSSGQALLIFRSDIIDGITFVRKQSAVISLSETVGLRVPVSSVRMFDTEDGARAGVYVMYKGSAEVRYVNVLYESEGYYICEKKAEAGYLSLNDRIITGDKDLYQGKVVG